jgi:hypothetical protein
MKKLLMLSGLVGLALLRLLPLHLAKANDKGSPKPEQAFEIDKPMSAQAIYGRLDSDKATEYYTLAADKGAELRAILMIPTKTYQTKGLRATFTLQGAGLPDEGAKPKESEGEHTIAGRDYMIVRSYVPALPETGEYRITVERLEGEGVYCLCVGTENEGVYASPETRAKVNALLAQDE